MSLRRKRTGLPEEVPFPVTPFLDMAFQLLAFFILTFRPPSNELRLDLYLPTAAAALPQWPQATAKAPSLDDPDLETDLVVAVRANPDGSIGNLKLGDTAVTDLSSLEARLTRYRSVLSGQPLRIRLEAPDILRYEEAAKLIATCSRAGVSSVKLSGRGEDLP